MKTAPVCAFLMLGGIGAVMLSGTQDAVAEHEQAARVEVRLTAVSGLFPDSFGSAEFVRRNGGWEFSVSITGGEPSFEHEVTFFELETSLVGTPTPISGQSFALCSITTDAGGSGTCSGQLDELAEPAEIVVFLASQEGVLLRGMRANGDFTFVPMVPATDLPATGAGPSSESTSSSRATALIAIVAITLLAAAVVTAWSRRATNQ